MAKISRWKGGIKEGNRRESDMTDGSFNQKYDIKGMDMGLDDPSIDWRISVNPTQHSLDTGRIESGNVSNKVQVEDSVYTDNFVTNKRGGGLIYDDDFTRQQLLRTGVRGGEKNTVLSDPSASLDIMIGESKTLRFIETTGPIFRFNDLPVNNYTYLADFWEIEFTVLETRVYHANYLYIKTPGVPYRWSFTTPDGFVFYENISKYEWSLITEYGQSATEVTKGLPDLTEIQFLDPFFLEEGDIVRVRLETLTPVEMEGFLNTGVPGPHDGGLFLLNADGDGQDVVIIPIDFKDVISASSVYCYEWAARDNATPNSIHLSNMSLIVDEDCEYIEWIP